MSQKKLALTKAMKKEVNKLKFQNPNQQGNGDKKMPELVGNDINDINLRHCPEGEVRKNRQAFLYMKSKFCIQLKHLKIKGQC